MIQKVCNDQREDKIYELIVKIDWYEFNEIIMSCL
jgi:hypothetical protein